MEIKIIAMMLALSLGLQSKAHVALDNPLGGETFIAGEIVIAEWHETIPHNTLNWDLYFSSDEGITWEIIEADIPYAVLSYEWTVPEIITTQGRIRVVQDNEGMDYNDFSQNFTIVPGPPEIEIEAQDLALECNINNEATINIWLDSHGGAIATSLCGNLIWANDFSGLSDECGATGFALVTFTATDSCGHSSITYATVEVTDNNTPTIHVPAQSITVECDGLGNTAQLNAWLDGHGGAVSSDSCGSISWSHSLTTQTDDCGSSFSTLAVFTVTDECGGTSTTMAEFTTADTTAPGILIPAQNMIVNCDLTNLDSIVQLWLDNHGGSSASDICGEISWIHDFSPLSDSCEAAIIPVMFTAIDACGNSSTTIATVEVTDNNNPTIYVPAQSITVECDGSGNTEEFNAWLNSQGGALSSEGCGSINWSHSLTTQSDTCGSSFSIFAVFTVTDECGGTSTTSAEFTAADTTAPGILIPAQNLTVNCDVTNLNSIIQLWLNNHGEASASDICGEISWIHDFSPLSDSCEAAIIPVMFTAIDACGNSSSTMAMLTIEAPSGIRLPLEYLNINVFPNPSGDYIHVEFGIKANSPKTLLLFDLKGSLVWEKIGTTNNYDIRIADFSKGIYLLKVITESGSLIQKVVIE